MAARLERVGRSKARAAQRGAGMAFAPRSRASALREELLSPRLSFLMEAHDGLSAKIVEEAGFRGIWASGLAISAALGVRDSNEASWTQVLEVLEFMSDATTIPILVDGDTGYGNFNNMRRLVRKLCQRQIAGVCIEDKLFPKTNSFIGEGQPLADIDEFCGKIKAGKDSQTDPDFSIVARIEALISGWGLDEALRRAEAYRDAGADAVLIHSKAPTADEVLAFAREWDRRCPVVIVPTMYPDTEAEAFRAAGISTVIWANHNLRAAISAMRETSRAVQQSQSIAKVERQVASVRDVFDLAGNSELAEAERRYLPAPRLEVGAVVLAASRGAALGPLTEDRPKCMLDVRGRPLLHRLVATLREGGIRRIAVVRGYRKDAIDLAQIDAIDNDAYETTGEAASLACAAERLAGTCVIAYGDMLFRRYMLDNLIATEGDVVLAVDALWKDDRGRTRTRFRDLVAATRKFTGSYLDEEPVSMIEIGNDLDRERVAGEWIGLAKLSAEGAKLVRAELAAMEREGALATAGLPELFNRLVARGAAPRILYVTGHWLDVDDAFDLASARNTL
jgi:phosphoenolpyruvate phosphomutase